MTREFFFKLRGSTPHVIPIPETVNGLEEAARMAEKYVDKYSRAFCNTETRETIVSDADYVAMVLSVLKTRCGVSGGIDAERIILHIEKCNTNISPQQVQEKEIWLSDSEEEIRLSHREWLAKAAASSRRMAMDPRYREERSKMGF